MTKKVSLDTLDIEEPTISTHERGLGEDEQPEKPPAKWYRSQLFIISGVVFFMLVCTGLALFFFMGAPSKAPHSAPQAISPVAVGTGKAGVSGQPGFVAEEVKDFLIPLQAVNKDSRVLSIDLVLEMDSAHQRLFQEKVVLIRGAVYKTLNGMALDITQGKGGMEKVRAMIAASLETLLGKGFVTNVWVTKFVVL